MSYYLHATKFFLESETRNGGYLEITDDGKFGKYLPESSVPSGKIVDLSEKLVAPGLVDTHIHGLLNHDVMDNDWSGIQVMSEGLLKAGVTSWLPTTLTGSFEQLDAVCQMIGQNAGSETGAKIQGIYFEGPYFTVKHKGAQNPKYFRNPSFAEFTKWQGSAKGLLKKIAIAPEREGAVEFTKQVVSTKTVVALGHSDATFAQAQACIEAGASVFTHTFNGMSGLSHREPGMVGAAMYFDHIYDELICDGHHVRPEVVKILLQAKHPEQIALITDCMRAGMMSDGDYVLGELPVYVKDGMARLKDNDALAGSILKLSDAIYNVVNWNYATPTQAIMMASQVAAKSSGIADRCGSISLGRDADFIVLNPDLTLDQTYLNGQKRYQA